MTEQNKKKTVTIQETLQIMEVVFKYVSSIPDLPTKILYEEISDKVPCLALIQEDGGGKTNMNVIGGYDAEIPFNIYYKIDGKDTQSRLDATKVLTYLGAYLEQKTKEKQLPNLDDDKRKIKKIEMIAAPVLLERFTNGHHLYAASFSVIYTYKPF